MSARFMDWNDIRDVLLIHDEGSLSAAARRAGVSQSTMSRRLAAIEAGGRKIFIRGPGGSLSLTERGSAFLAAGRQMQAALRANVTEFDQPKAPPLRIAACEVTAHLFMADALSAWLRNRDAAADMAIYEDLFALRPTEYDLLVMPADEPPEGTVGIEIGRIDWGLYAAPSYLSHMPVPKDASGLAQHRVILASGSLERVAMYRWLAEQGGEASLSSSSPMAQREACARGQGVALLPRALAEDDPRLQPLRLTGLAGSPVWLLSDVHEASNPRVAAFLRWARRHFRSAPGTESAGLRKRKMERAGSVRARLPRAIA